MLKFKILILFPLITALAAACAQIPATSSPIVTTTPTVSGGTVVKSIEILLLESFPLQVNAVLRGDLPDASCTTIDSVEQVREGNTFKLTVVTITDPLARCAAQPTPFEEVVSLDVQDLPAGTYTVEADGVKQTFEFTVDNTLGTAPPANQPTPPGTAESTDVQFVMAQQEVPIHDGPGDQYGTLGTIAAGQTAKVTGVSSDHSWWRVICPDDRVGSCWVSADPSLTQPAEAPGQ